MSNLYALLYLIYLNQGVVCQFALASHLFWGTWAVLQSQLSLIDFDFHGYAKLRFKGYWYHKEIFNSLNLVPELCGH